MSLICYISCFFNFLELKAGGKPSTWFPPGGLVEQDISTLTKSTYQINFSKKAHMLDSLKMECINTFHRVPFPNDLDLLQTPNSMRMTRITLQPFCCVSRHLSMLTINIYKQVLRTSKIKFIKISISSTNIIFNHASHLNLAN